MRIRQFADRWIVDTPAKLNLWFEVLAKREDGYHEIETLMCPVGLYDTLYFNEEPSGRIELQCEASVVLARRCRDVGRDEATSRLPKGPDNLVVRALDALRRYAGVARGACVRLVKRIPLGAGLGGGSSDAAGALVAANLGWGLGLSNEDLSRVAAGLGSDVPFFLSASAAICRGRGEKVERIASVGSLDFVVVCPPEGLSTAVVYSICEVAAAPVAGGPMLAAWKEGNRNRIGRLLLNRLQPAAARLSPWMERLRLAFMQEGSLGHGMSGSGTSYFGLCRHAGHARRMARRLEAKGVGDVFAVRSCR